MHDQGHEDLCVLQHAGEAPAGFEATLSFCPECRALLEDLRAGTLLAARAAVPPPAHLQARVHASFLPGPSRLLPRALALAALSVIAVMAVRWDGGPREAGQGSDALELDLARAQYRLEVLAESIGRGHELMELDDDIRVLQSDAATLRRQLGG